MNNHVLKCNSLSKKFGEKAALDNINLDIESGKIIGLLGPNGSGKTTLIKCATGLLLPSGGEILINGAAPGKESKKIVSYLPDRISFDESMKVESLVRMFEDFYEDFDRKKAEGMISALGIDPKARLKTLSKGNKEKIQLIVTMSRQASLYLLDEPIGGVDPATRDYILDSIIKNYSENASVIISTHLIADVEKILDDVIFIRSGNIILHESAESIREREGKSIDEVFREVFKCQEN